jgi:hypothetical protein
VYEYIAIILLHTKILHLMQNNYLIDFNHKIKKIIAQVNYKKPLNYMKCTTFNKENEIDLSARNTDNNAGV